VKDDSEDPHRLMVAFWGFSAICYLTRDHPEFERIRTTLEEAAASGSMVCFAKYTWPEESETEIWNKIMDVRPVPAPTPSSPRAENTVDGFTGAQDGPRTAGTDTGRVPADTRT
jgi:hypothetical protein